MQGNTPGEMGMPVQGRDLHARSVVYLTTGWAETAELLRGIRIRSSRDLVCAFKEPGRTPRGIGALNSGASPLIVQTQFLYESAANRELWLDICG